MPAAVLIVVCAYESSKQVVSRRPSSLHFRRRSPLAAIAMASVAEGGRDQHEGESPSSAITGKGLELLKRHGYKEGRGLGKEEQGQLEPVPAYYRFDRRGVGAETEESAVHVERATEVLAEQERGEGEGRKRKECQRKEEERGAKAQKHEDEEERRREVHKRVFRMFARADVETTDVSPLARSRQDLSSTNPLRDPLRR